MLDKGENDGQISTGRKKIDFFSGCKMEEDT